jgi:hypothetical protein
MTYNYEAISAWRVSQAVHGDSFENYSPEREAQVRILYPPLSHAEAQRAKDGFARVSAEEAHL